MRSSRPWLRACLQTIDDIHMFKFSTDAVSASAIIMFAFTCQVNVPSLYYELQERNLDQMCAVSRRGVAVCVLLYVVIGISGYANFPEANTGNLLNNYCVIDPSKVTLALHSPTLPPTLPPNLPPTLPPTRRPSCCLARQSSYSDDPPRVMAPAFGAITLTVLMAYPVNVYPCRYALDVVCFAEWGEQYQQACSLSTATSSQRPAAPAVRVAPAALPDTSMGSWSLRRDEWGSPLASLGYHCWWRSLCQISQ